MTDDSNIPIFQRSEDQLIEEWVCNGNVSFINTENIALYDFEGNIVLCKCGKLATHAAIGKEASMAWCSDCSPLNQSVASFTTWEPTKEQKQKLINMGFIVPE